MNSFHKTTESTSHYERLEEMPLSELLYNINKEDESVPKAVAACIPQIEALVQVIVEKMRVGGRLFYLGSGTSGRLGIVDASECPPTFGVPFDWVVGLIAGGDAAIRKAQEFAEDDTEAGWKDLEAWKISADDVVIGITASGTTPYVLGAIQAAKAAGIVTGGITCNAGSPLTSLADFPIAAVVGPEFVTGSTRMKAGTAQKLILNMISTSTMIRLGRVKGNKMVDMQLTNHKLIERGALMIQEASGLGQAEARALLLQYGNVRAALESLNL